MLRVHISVSLLRRLFHTCGQFSLVYVFFQVFYIEHHSTGRAAYVIIYIACS